MRTTRLLSLAAGRKSASRGFAKPADSVGSRTGGFGTSGMSPACIIMRAVGFDRPTLFGPLCTEKRVHVPPAATSGIQIRAITSLNLHTATEPCSLQSPQSKQTLQRTPCQLRR